MRLALSFVCTLGLLFVASRSSADAIGGARDDCPRGTHATMPTRHGEGSTCELYPTCTRTAACGAGHRCLATAICIDQGYVVGACGALDACERGTCTHARRCAGNTPFGALTPRVRPAAQASVAVLGLAVFATTVLVRRRSRDDRRSRTNEPGL